MEAVPYTIVGSNEKVMTQPIVVDGRNIYDCIEVEQEGFSYLLGGSSLLFIDL